MDRAHRVRVSVALIPACLVLAPWLVPLLAAFVAWRRGIGGSRRTAMTPYVGAVVMAAGLTTVANANDPDAWLGLALLLAVFTGLAAGWWLLRADDAPALAVGAGLVLALEAGWAVLEVALGGAPRAHGSTYHPNVLGALVTLLGFVALAAADEPGAILGGPRRRLVWTIGIAVLVAIPLLLSGSRAAIGAAVVGVVVLAAGRVALSTRAPPRASLATVAVAALVVAAAAAWVVWLPQTETRWSGLDGALDPEGRPAIWGVATEAIVHRPLLGHGISSWRRVLDVVDPSLRWERMVNAHNGFLSVAVDGGALLLTTVLGWIAVVGRELLRQVRRGNPRAVAAAAALLAFLTHNLAESFLQNGVLLALALLPVSLALQPGVAVDRADDGSGTAPEPVRRP